MLAEERPADGRVGEEGDAAAGAGERRWLVDPLDGTTNFLYGYPWWSVSIALEDAGGGRVAVVHDPVRGETFRASRGGGAELDGVPVAVRRSSEPATALLATGFGYRPELRARQAEALVRVLPRVRDVRRAGSAALDLAWLAAGRLDGYWEVGLRPWDWAAGTLLVREAGGAVAALPGDPPGLAAAGPELLPALLELVAPVAGRSAPGPRPGSAAGPSRPSRAGT